MTTAPTNSTPGLPIVIRHMRAEDLEQVQAIDKVSFSMPWPASAYRYELFENLSSLLWVAEAPEARIAGMIVIWMIMDEAHIATIAVHPNYRARGISQRLLVSAMQEAIQKGAHSATLEVRASNTIAHQLYRRFGFQIVGSRTHYYKDNNEDAIIMTVDGLDKEYLDWLISGEWQSQSFNTV